MKTALVIPPSTIEEQYGSLSKAAPELPSLGIAFIAKYLELNDIETDIFDFAINPKSLDDFLRKINKYDIIGMPVYITTRPNVLNFVKLIKKKNPFITIVVGGPHATLFPHDLMTDDIDIVVEGEGEVPFFEIIRQLNKNQKLSQIKGIYYKEGSDFIYTGKGQLFLDLDEIDSPSIEKFDLPRYVAPIHVLGNNVVHTLTTRGCPYNCKFCAAATIFKSRVRYRSVHLVIAELKNYFETGYDSIIFYDDSFTINRKRSIELCKKIIKEKQKIKWMCFTRPDLVDRELLHYMNEAGCYLITFGCESGNNKTLKLLNKKLTVDQNREAIGLTNETGIMAASTFMLGLPGEDRSDIESTIAFALESDLTFAYFPIFEPYKGTDIYDICKETGSWIKDERFNNYLLEFQGEIWVPHGLRREQIEKAAKQAFKRFYWRCKTIYRIGTNVWIHLPMMRKMNFIMSGIDYFLLSRYRKIAKRTGSRY